MSALERVGGLESHPNNIPVIIYPEGTENVSQSQTSLFPTLLTSLPHQIQTTKAKTQFRSAFQCVYM